MAFPELPQYGGPSLVPPEVADRLKALGQMDTNAQQGQFAPPVPVPAVQAPIATAIAPAQAAIQPVPAAASPIAVQLAQQGANIPRVAAITAPQQLFQPHPFPPQGFTPSPHHAQLMQRPEWQAMQRDLIGHQRRMHDYLSSGVMSPGMGVQPGQPQTVDSTDATHPMARPSITGQY